MSDPVGRMPASDGFTVPSRYWHLLEDGRIQCDVCPRACKLREGQRGVCFVRARLDDQVVLTSHGRSSGFCVDPIEKKPLNPGVLLVPPSGCDGVPYGRRPNRGLTHVQSDSERAATAAGVL